MVKDHYFSGICAALVLLMASIGQAQYFSHNTVKLLDESAQSELRPEALELYQQAVESLNRVDIDGGIGYMEKALDADPNSVDLAFLTAELARKRARVTHGATARRYFELATNAFNLILSRDDIDQDVQTRDRAQKMNRMTREEMDNLDLRELKRQEKGINVSLAIAQEYDLPLQETLDGDNADLSDLDPTRPFHFQVVETELPLVAAPAPQPTNDPFGAPPGAYGAGAYGGVPGEFGGGGFGQPAGGGFGQPGGGFGQPGGGGFGQGGFGGGGFGQPGGGFGGGGFGQPAGGGFGQPAGGGFGQPAGGNPFAPAGGGGNQGGFQQIPGGGVGAF